MSEAKEPLILRSQDARGVVTLTLNRPAAFNSFDLALKSALLAALEAAADPSVRAVVLRSAERAMRNPGGFSSESSGDYSYQRTGTQQPGVFLTDGELRILRRAVGRTGLWTQPVTRGDDYADTVFLEDSYGCELFPVDTYVEGRMTY